ncbi:MAG: hypothetical protein JSU93_06235 [Methanobacteriota archaeon]|nr:MAG: hypothetical protein JSU93_06235 [Euryarchaeota archaeon]
MSPNVFTGSVKLVFVAAALAVFVLSMLASSSSAHIPAFDTGEDSYNTAEVIDNPDTSYAFYGELPSMIPGSPVGARYYALEVAGSLEFSFEVGRRDLFFAPCVLLTGPGLPSPDENTQNIIDSSGLSLPDGYGALGWSFVFLPYLDYIPEREFEPFTQTTFYYSYRESVLLPSEGTYYLVLTGVVYSEELGDYQVTSGKYLLVTGNLEEFTVKDYVLMPWYWSKVQSFWGEQGRILFLLPTAVVLVGLLAVEWMRKRKDEAFRAEAKPKRFLYFGGLAGSFLMIGAAVNQVSFLVRYMSLHDWSGIVLLVLALQLGGLALGAISASITKSQFFQMSGGMLITVAVIAALALLLGAGLILGPVLFFGSLAIVTLLGRKTRQSRLLVDEDQDSRDSKSS